MKSPLRWAALVVAAVCACQGRADAASGTVHNTSGYGLNLSVDTQWPDGFGYRPVRIRVSPLTPPVADRTLTVQFLVRRNWNRDGDLEVQQQIEIPAGSGPVEATISVPQYVAWNSYSVNVLEDGVLRKRLCIPWTGVANTMLEWGECFPTVLFAGNNPPDTTRLASVLPVGAYYRTQGSTGSGLPLPTPGVAARPLAEFPRRWIDYSTLDVVCLSLDELGQLRRVNEPAFRALRQWVAAGGNLWAYGVGRGFPRLDELQRLLDLAPGSREPKVPDHRRWKAPDKSLYGRPIRSVLRGKSGVINSMYVEGIDNPSNVLSTPEESPREPPAPQGEAPADPPFLLRPCELGLVVALAADDPFPGTPAQWGWLLGSMGSPRWAWFQRHGLSMSRENRDFWNFLIPGVGLVPVIQFCVLITLFVAAIGPLNYWLLYRRRRLHLLVVTIPLSAATVTLLLFAYALVSDGLGTRVRVRSVTQLDQRRGQAVCWARLSYYAGLAPSRGLELPPDVAVLPLEYLPANGQMGRTDRLRRSLTWDENQWLTSGWLNSRTPTQYLTVRSRASPCGLDLAPAGEAGRLAVKNRLGTRVEQLAVCSPEGKNYWAEGIEPGAVAPLEPIEPGEALSRLRQTLRANQPAVPPNMDDRYRGSMFGFSPRIRFPMGFNSPIDPATQQTGRLEMALAELGASSNRDASPLGPGSYVAVVKQSPEVVLGVRSAREEASYHVVFGKW